MARIILEDMKSNKGRKPTILKKEIIHEAVPVLKKDIYEENISKPILNDREYQIKEREIEKAKESKINEYFSNRNNDKPKIQRTPQVKTKHVSLHKPFLIVFIICIIFGGIYWGGNFFQKADVTVTAKHQTITYNNKQFTASKDSNDGQVNFEIMIVSDKKTKDVILTAPTDVSLKAKGGITLYNEFSTAQVKLTAGTFLTDEDGKSYKLDNTVTIPGYTTDANKKVIPGQIITQISSFLPGDTYNGSPTDFYVNSFKGTKKYNKIYGKLQSPLTGGAIGTVYTLDDNTKNDIATVAQSSLKDDLLKQVKALVPPGYILYPDAFVFSYTTPDDIISKTPETGIEIDGSLSVVLLNEKSLMDNIIKTSLPDILGSELLEVKIPDMSKFIFSFTDKDQLITKDMDTVSFTLTGDTDAIWTPDIELLKTKLQGVNYNAVLPIFREDKGIAQALVKIFPPWQKTLPNDLSKINIIMK